MYLFGLDINAFKHFYDTLVVCALIKSEHLNFLSGLLMTN